MTRHVLIIEDNAPMRDLIAINLRKRAFEVTGCEDAQAAFEALAATTHFDAVVTDVNMRGLDGIEFCRRVADSHPSLPVIVITAFGSMDTAIAALRAGAVDFIPKPFEFEQLTSAVERALEPRFSANSVVEKLQSEAEFLTLDDLERRYILHVVEARKGNRSLAAATLGVDRKTLYRKLLQYSGKTKASAGSEIQTANQER